MAVEGVNSNNSNAGLYAAGGALLGAGAGAGAAYLTRPFLKDGAPTDSFVKNIGENLLEVADDETKEYAKLIKEFPTKIAEVKDKESLKKLIQDNQKAFKISDEGLTKILNGIEVADFETVKTSMAKLFQPEVDSFNNFVNEESVKAFKEAWDAEKKKFVNPGKEIMEEADFNAIKKAARSIQNKYAMIYGGIAAAVLGIGAYLFASLRKPAEAPQGIDTQA